MAAITGAVIAGAGATASLIQGYNQGKLKRKAEANAALAVEQAKKSFDQNPFAALSVPTKDIELAGKEITNTAADIMRGVTESDQRGAAAGAGAVYGLAAQNQNANAAEYEQRISNLDKLKANQEVANILKYEDLYKAQAEGAQIARKEAAEFQAQAFSDAIAGFGQAGVNAVNAYTDTYPQEKD